MSLDDEKETPAYAIEAVHEMAAAGALYPSDESDGWMRMVATFVAMEDDKLVLTIDRERFQPGRTFSAEAMEALGEHMRGWVTARIWRHWEMAERAPQKIRVYMRVEVEG